MGVINLGENKMPISANQSQSIKTVQSAIANAIKACRSLDSALSQELRSLLRLASQEAGRIGKSKGSKASSKKAPAKKAPVKKAAAKSAPAQKAVAKKAATKATKTEKKAPAKKTTAVKKPAAKKAPAKKTLKAQVKRAAVATSSVRRVNNSNRRVALANGLVH
jgi:uncharacterized membrane-anchored protein